MSEKWPNDIKVEIEGRTYWMSEVWADKKRIDWLIETKCFPYFTEEENRQIKWMVCAPDPGDGYGEYNVEGGSTWREAVDNSMESWEASKEQL